MTLASVSAELGWIIDPGVPRELPGLAIVTGVDGVIGILTLPTGPGVAGDGVAILTMLPVRPLAGEFGVAGTAVERLLLDDMRMSMGLGSMPF
jgi:hypothetical protein